MAYQDDPEVFDQAYALYQQGRFQESYDLLTTAQPSHPQHNQRLYEWRFDIAARMGQLKLAEQVLQDALDAGCYYGDYALRKDDDLKEMQGRPRFEALVERNFAMLAEAQKHARPMLEVLNRGVEEKSTLPLLLALHGNNSNNFRFRQNWSSLQGSSWLVALAQSSQVSGKGLYSWNDMAMVEKEIREHYRQLIKAFPVDPKRVILSGFSKGGHAAILAMVRGWVMASGFLAIAPYVGDVEAWKPHLEEDYGGELRGAFLLGEKDELCTPGALALSEILIARGIPCQVTVFPGMAHEFPENFAAVLQSAFRFLLKEE